MPAGVVKRGRGRPRKTPVPASSTPTTINAFAKVSKTNKLATKKEAALNAAVSSISLVASTTPVKATRSSSANVTTTPPSVAQPTPTTTKTTRKRKAPAATVVSDTEDDEVASTPSLKKKSSSSPATKRARCSNGSPQQQQQKKTGGSKKTDRRQAQPQLSFVRASSTDSDLSVANNTLSRLRLGGSGRDAASSAAMLSQSFGSSSYATPATSDTSASSESESEASSVVPAPLPQELADTCSIFSSFLSTLSLHATYASGGAIECKALLPDVSRSFKKRTVTVQDLRLLLGILCRSSKNILGLVDYGRGKFHVEVLAGAVFPLNESAMRATFEHTLRSLWRREKGNYFSPTAFLAALPRANVVKKPISRLALGLTPTKGGGQQTLEAFKESIAQKKREEAELAAKVAAAAEAAVATNSNRSKSGGGTVSVSVLDRVRAKESVFSALSQDMDMSPEACTRRRCLQRCADVAGVLGMLCSASRAPGGPMARVSMPMSQVSEKLKDSLGISLSVQEGMQTVRMIGLEVAPQWLKVVRMSGGRGDEHVVMTRGFAPGRAEVERRVRGIMG